MSVRLHPGIAFTFIPEWRSPSAEYAGTQTEDNPDTRARLEAFREKASKSKLVKFFKNPDELKSQVWQALHHAIDFKPGEGWVRAGNRTRTEDLENINNLQKQVMELAAENARLSRNPRYHLAQGDEIVRWEIEWRFQSPSNLPLPAPTQLRVSWNGLFETIFNDETYVYIGQVMEIVQKLCKSVSPEVQRDDLWPVQRIIDNILREIRVQFMGLGLIALPNFSQPGRPQRWSLTEAGSLHLALLVGKRSNANPDLSNFE